tara:strand:- start:1081 stop:1755 length:675 start_codon:yes stop_codon:yes gene_type:complete
MKVFIVMYNRLATARKLAEFLTNTGCEVILIDNKSTYPPLLEWYKQCPYKVHMLEHNYRERAFWDSKLFEEYKDEYYIVTDPDLDLTGIPLDYLEVLKHGLDNNKDIMKCGVSLRIDDLPINTYTREIKNFEGKYWVNKDKVGNWVAGVDTTFAMYDRKRQGKGWGDGDRFYQATRLPQPYTARHVPWYMNEESLIKSSEELYYHKNCNNQWASIFKREFKITL